MKRAARTDFNAARRALKSLVGLRVVAYSAGEWEDEAGNIHFDPTLILEGSSDGRSRRRRLSFTVTEVESGDGYGVTPHATVTR